MRQPIVANQFYEGSREGLLREIKECFLSEFGPGSLPKKRGNDAIKGAISPHAGYMFSGPCAAFSFKAIAESKFCDTYIVIGLSHQGFGSCISLEDFETPLGVVKNDTKLAKEITKNALETVKKFSWETTIDKLETILVKLVS